MTRNTLSCTSASPTRLGVCRSVETPNALSVGWYVIRRGLSKPKGIYSTKDHFAVTKMRGLRYTYRANLHLVDTPDLADDERRRGCQHLTRRERSSVQTAASSDILSRATISDANAKHVKDHTFIVTGDCRTRSWLKDSTAERLPVATTRCSPSTWHTDSDTGAAPNENTFVFECSRLS